MSHRLLSLLSFIIAIGMAEVGLGSCWSQLKEQHQMKRLGDKKYQRLSALSTIKEFKVEVEPLLVERTPDSEGSRCVQTHIRKRMSELGWTLDEDSFVDNTPYGEKNFTNIIATLNPQARRQLVLACHFDSKYFPPSASNEKFIGATDSAVPCAQLIDLARSLNYSLWNGPSNGAKDITLQFIFFDGEEAFVSWTSTDSLYGSRHLANKWRSTPHPLDADKTVLDGMDVFVLLDLIGASQPQFHNWFRETTTLFKRLHEIEAKLFKLGLLKEREPSYFCESRLVRGGGIEDDHIPFLRNGVPILHLIAHPFPDVWHQTSDNESILDYNCIDDINKILRIFVSEYLHLSM